MYTSLLRKHIGAIGFIAVVTAVTAAGFVGAADTTPVLDASTQMIVDSYVLPEANDITETGNVFSGARFNISSFVNHPCYVITGEEFALCSNTYGVTRDLKRIVDNGQLATYLQSKGLLATGAMTSSSSSASSVSSSSSSASVSSSGSSVSSSSSSSSENPFFSDIQKRARDLWALCSKEFPNGGARNCYQRNISLINRVGRNVTKENIF